MRQRKLISILVSIYLLCTFTSVTPIYADTIVRDASAEKLELTAYDSALEEYFEQRELLYTATSMELDAELFAAIQEWKDMLNITIQSAEVSFSPVEVLDTTTSVVKLRVYEWVWINYICNGYEKVEQMGYGVDHIIRLSDDAGGYQVFSDSYYDIATDCEYGVAEDLAVFESEVEAFESTVTASTVSLPATEASIRAATTTDNYDASRAISYANRWFGGTDTGYSTAGYNPKYSHYGSSDCCNFVSQCLAAGGMTMGGLWSATVFPDRTTPVQDTEYVHSGGAWRYVPTFKDYWVGQGYYMTQITDAAQAVPGNPIFWLAADGESNNHNMMIVGFNSAGQILCNSHSYNVKNMVIADLNAKKYYTIDFAHNHVSNNAQTHTCSLCGVTESHDSDGEMLFDDIRHYFICSACGATTGSEYHSLMYIGYYECTICYYNSMEYEE